MVERGRALALGIDHGRAIGDDILATIEIDQRLPGQPVTHAELVLGMNVACFAHIQGHCMGHGRQCQRGILGFAEVSPALP